MCDIHELYLNRIQFYGESREIEKLLSHFKSSRSLFDFTKVINDLDCVRKENFFMVRNYRRKNWGSTSNSINASIDGTIMEFLTEMGHPREVVKQMSVMFPRIGMSVFYASQEFMYNFNDDYRIAMIYDIKNGVVANPLSLNETSDLAWKFWFCNYWKSVKEQWRKKYERKK